MSVNNILNTKFCFMTALTSVGNVQGRLLHWQVEAGCFLEKVGGKKSWGGS